MSVFLTIVHIIACLSLILIVLVQSGKGAGISGMFGSGGGSDQLFSASSGLAFIKKVTVAIALVFMFTSITLTYLASRRVSRTVTRPVAESPQ